MVGLSLSAARCWLPDLHCGITTRCQPWSAQGGATRATCASPAFRRNAAEPDPASRLAVLHDGLAAAARRRAVIRLPVLWCVATRLPGVRQSPRFSC